MWEAKLDDRGYEIFAGQALRDDLLDKYTSQSAQRIPHFQLIAALAASVKPILFSLISCIIGSDS